MLLAKGNRLYLLYLKELFMFVQVTDLHISEHKRPEIASDLEKWCVQMHDVIKPQFILVTGKSDLQ